MNIFLHIVDLFKQICNQTNVLNAVQFDSKKEKVELYSS